MGIVMIHLPGVVVGKVVALRHCVLGRGECSHRVVGERRDLVLVRHLGIM